MPTVTSETAVANLALQHLGERRILDIGETTEKAAIEMKQAFAITRQTLLRDHLFSFSEDWIALQRLSALPLARYNFAYALPNDFIRALGVNDDQVETQAEFELGSEGRLLTDEAIVDLHYIKDVPVVTRWDSLFVEAMALSLAMRTCKVITGSDTLVEEVSRKFQGLAMPSAKAANAREGRPEQPWHYRESRLVKSRRNSALG